METNEKPLVSVILCFCNDELVIEEAIRSVLAQEYEQWELMLVDDGASDTSSQIAKQYTSDFPDRIFYVEHVYHQSKGLSASRNLGFKQSRGKFIAFIDPADAWLPGKLGAQLEIFREHPTVTVVLGASQDWRSWNDPAAADAVVQVGVQQGIYQAPQLIQALYPLGNGAAPSPSSIMVQRTVLRRCVFEELFRGIYQMYENQAFLCKVYLKEIVFVSAQHHTRCRYDGMTQFISAHESGNYHRVRSYYLYWLKNYLNGQPYAYKAVKALLRRAQMPYREPLLYKITVDYPQQIRRAIHRVLMKAGILGYSKSW